MLLGRQDTATMPNRWRPQGVRGWVSATGAVAFVVGLAAAAVAMAYPLPFDTVLGLGGTVLLAFPLHLLGIAALTTGLALVCWRRLPRLSLAALATAMLVSAVMALWPGVAIWRFARYQHVGLSLRDYVVNATHLNLGLPQSDRTTAYGMAGDGTELLLDVWRATDNQPANTIAKGALRPALVRVHGGAFIRGNRSDMPDWNRWFNSLGYTVFDVEYRLPPPVRWRDETGDVKCALGWVAAHAGEYAIDPERISITGFSAGANLAMLAAYSVGDRRLPPSCAVPPVRVRSVVNLYGDTDLAAIYDDSPSRGLVRAAAVQYIGGSPVEYPERHAEVSPLTYVSAASPPTISFLGTSDRIIPADQLVRLDEALKRAGVDSDAYLIPATDHGFDVNWGGFATQFARVKIAAFLRRHG